MKIFLSGPISDKKDYRLIFAIYEKWLTLEGHLVMNPAVLPEGFEWEEYMQITLPMMEVCDNIALLPGWETSAGALRELDKARALGKNIMVLPPIGEALDETRKLRLLISATRRCRRNLILC